MPLANTARLEAFARLIALGHPPVLAAKAAGYRNLRVAAAAKETVAVGAAHTSRPSLPPMSTEEEWGAEFATLIQRETTARA